MPVVVAAPLVLSNEHRVGLGGCLLSSRDLGRTRASSSERNTKLPELRVCYGYPQLVDMPIIDQRH